MSASDTQTARPASEAWCPMCRSWRRYRNQPVPKGNFRHAAGYHTDALQCVGCDTTILTIRAAEDHA